MIGTTLSHYRILEKLGQGGKVLPEAFPNDPERMARFEREAKLLASLSHQNIASIFGLEEADGKRFIIEDAFRKTAAGGSTIWLMCELRLITPLVTTTSGTQGSR